jgi:hypothetical protein
MDDEDNWQPVTPSQRQSQPAQQAAPPSESSSDSEWKAVTRPAGAPKPSAPMIEASPQYRQDVELVGEPSAKGAAEIFGTNAANMALFNLPSHALTWARRGLEEVPKEEREAMGTVSQRYQKQAGKLPPAAERRFQETVQNVPSIAEEYYRDYAAQKEREAALQRQHPVAGAAGTGTGFLVGMAMPLGPLSKPGQLAGRGVESLATGALSQGAAKHLAGWQKLAQQVLFSLEAQASLRSQILAGHWQAQALALLPVLFFLLLPISWLGISPRTPNL